MTIRDDIAALLRSHAMPALDEDYPRDEYECCADAILTSYALVELPEPRIMTEPELADLDPGAGPELWTGSLHRWCTRGRFAVNDRGHSFSATTLRCEAAAMLAAAHALETKENNR